MAGAWPRICYSVRRSPGNGHGIGEADRGADGMMESRAGCRWPRRRRRGSGVQNEGPAGGALRSTSGQEFRIEGGQDFLFDKGGDELFQFRLGEAAQVGQEDALQGAGAEQMGRFEHGGRPEQGEVGPAEGMLFQDEIAEQNLGIVGQQRLIEVEDGEGHGVECYYKKPVRGPQRRRWTPAK